MQETETSIEREATQRVPELLRELLDEPASIKAEIPPRDTGIDLLATDGRGRQWVVEVKSSSSPGRVALASEQLLALTRGKDIPLLVVPHMSPAGAKAAEEAGLNWLDLSGNAHIRARELFINVRGRPNRYRARGRPSSPFAPKSARVARVMLVEPERWWRQKDLVTASALYDGNVSRIVRRLDEELLLERRGLEVRPRDPGALLDAWAQDYRYGHHDIVPGHITGEGIELARTLSARLSALGAGHAFTGLPAAWAIDHFARFRLTSVYVDADPRELADRVEMRVTRRGANVQLIGPDDGGVFYAEREQEGLNCVAAVQVYLDLLALPERAKEAAEKLREHLFQADGAA
jgi:Transcriptional regulator, AbiEi antitoxin, Type IV TA system